MLIINLTPDQVAALAGARNQIGRMADDGKPGAICAQIYGDHMRVGIMSNEAVHKMYEAMGTPPQERGAHKSAYDIEMKSGRTTNAYGSHPDDEIHAGDDLMGSSS